MLAYFYRDPTTPTTEPIQTHIGRWDTEGTYVTGLSGSRPRRLGEDSIVYDAETDTVYWTTEELVDNGDGTFSETVKVWTAPGGIWYDEGGVPATEPLVTATYRELQRRRILINGDRLYLFQQWKVDGPDDDGDGWPDYSIWTASLWAYDKITGQLLDEYDLEDHDRDILGLDFIELGGTTMLAVSDQALAPDLPHRVRSYDLAAHAYTGHVLCYPETQHPDPNYLPTRWLVTRTQDGVSTLWFDDAVGGLCEFDLQGNLLRTLTRPTEGGTGGRVGQFTVDLERAYAFDPGTGYGDNYLTLVVWDLTTDTGTNITPAFTGVEEGYRYRPLAMCIGPVVPVIPPGPTPDITGQLVGSRRRFWRTG